MSKIFILISIINSHLNQRNFSVKLLKDNLNIFIKTNVFILSFCTYRSCLWNGRTTLDISSDGKTIRPPQGKSGPVYANMKITIFVCRKTLNTVLLKPLKGVV